VKLLHHYISSVLVLFELSQYQTTLTHLIYNGEEVSQVEAGETVYFMLTETPFYAATKVLADVIFFNTSL
jgi:alanyl-tRNA synthetase